MIGALGCSLTAWLAPRGRAEFVIRLRALALASSIVASAAFHQSWYPLIVMRGVIPAALLGSDFASKR